MYRISMSGLVFFLFSTFFISLNVYSEPSVQLQSDSIPYEQTVIPTGGDDPAPFPWSQCVLKLDSLVGFWEITDSPRRLLEISLPDDQGVYNVSISGCDRVVESYGQGRSLKLGAYGQFIAGLIGRNSERQILKIISYCNESLTKFKIMMTLEADNNSSSFEILKKPDGWINLEGELCRDTPYEKYPNLPR